MANGAGAIPYSVGPSSRSGEAGRKEASSCLGRQNRLLRWSLIITLSNSNCLFTPEPGNKRWGKARSAIEMLRAKGWKSGASTVHSEKEINFWILISPAAITNSPSSVRTHRCRTPLGLCWDRQYQRIIRSVHYGVSHKHPPWYMVEFCYRFNRRF